MADQLRLGIIGTGTIAEAHLKVLTAFDDVAVVAVCNRGEERRHAVVKQFRVRRGYADFREMLDREALDGVFVLVSISNIVEVAAECLR